MLKRAGHTLLAGLVVGSLLGVLSAPAAADNHGAAAGYLLDNSGAPVLSGSAGCVLTPSHPKDKLFAECGDMADSDGDGVSDDKDKCPNTPKGVKVNEDGCPLTDDADGDGIPDAQDRCPGTPAGVKVDAYGCPLDSDGDGIPDYKDDCPNTPADLIHKVDEKGCAPVDKVVRANLDDAVLFDFDKSDLKAGAKTVLDGLAQKIVSEDSYVTIVYVTGHTDSVGSDAYNVGLSKRRADAVANYLKSKGVSASKVSVVAKGESEPVADNKTATGRAKNRRVVVDVNMTK